MPSVVVIEHHIKGQRMSILQAIKLRRSPKDKHEERNTPKHSPLTQSTMAVQKTSLQELEREVTDYYATNGTPKREDHLRGTSLSPTDSPTITIHNSTTPGPKYCNNRPPPLSIPSRKDSLGVGGASIPVSQSLDDLKSADSRTSLESVSPVHRPSSPLLNALREAVDSVSNMDDFDIIEKIGSGFFAEVLKVRHISTDQIMVLKINRKQTSHQTKREVELLKKLDHPNLLHYLGACIHNGQLHPLTEYINGGTLEELIQDTSKEFPPSLRIQLAYDLSKGMEYLHDHGMLHRDFNSHNCLLRRNGSKYTAVVADFGLAAKNPRNLVNLNRAQSVVGTPYWMAPEVLEGKPYDGSADVFSYGIVLCEIISRKEADPDEIPRNKDFSLNAGGFKALPEVVNSQCPSTFIELACSCSVFLPLKRPEFTDINVLLDVLTTSFGSGRGRRSESLPPTPDRRLSWHHTQFSSPQTHPVSKQTVV